jgi:hypothetical protein
MLTNNGTDTEWFRSAANACAGVCFTQARIHFMLPDGKQMGVDGVNPPTQGQAFFYYGKNVKRFEEVFHRIGVCFPPPSRHFVANEESSE